MGLLLVVEKRPYSPQVSVARCVVDDMSTRTGILSIVALVALATASPAMASDPATGTVSDTSPLVTWHGQAPGYGVTVANILTTSLGRDAVCPPKACDTFQLNVATSHPL